MNLVDALSALGQNEVNAAQTNAEGATALPGMLKDWWLGKKPAPAGPQLLDPGLDARLSALAASLNQGQGQSVDLGSAGLPGQVAAPQMVMPDYSKADAAFASAKPHPISAPQYVQADYGPSDALWKSAAPAAITDDQRTNDMWGKILSGAASGFLDTGKAGGLKRGWGAILGGLGGYGTALENRTKMSVDQANRTSDYLIKDAGYESGKAKDIADTTNNQGTANYSADRNNQNSLETYGEALGGYETKKASDIADTKNKGAELQYNAQTRNADIQSEKRGVKVIGQNKDQIVYQWIDDKGNLNIGTKPISSFSSVNGKTGGKMGSPGGMGAAGLETLIQQLRAGGALRAILSQQKPDGSVDDSVYQSLVSPESDYAPGTGSMGSLATLGDAGKSEAFDRSQKEENANIANYFMAHPDLLSRALDMVMGQK